MTKSSSPAAASGNAVPFSEVSSRPPIAPARPLSTKIMILSLATDTPASRAADSLPPTAYTHDPKRVNRIITHVTAITEAQRITGNGIP